MRLRATPALRRFSDISETHASPPCLQARRGKHALDFFGLNCISPLLSSDDPRTLGTGLPVEAS
jgi:hypothetical protein